MQDLRLAVRALRATPIVTTVAVLSLALGIGANTAIFSILNSLLLKPLPVFDPYHLVVVSADDPNEGIRVSYPVWTQIRERNPLNRPFAWATDRVSATSPGKTAFAEAIWTTAEFFDVLGIRASVGRTFGEDDNRRGGGPHGPVAVISDRLWQTRFERARDAIGHTLTIERVPFTIVGVTPPGFLGLNIGLAFDVILPLETEPLIGRIPIRVDTPTWPWLQIMARLGPEQTPQQATAALRQAQPQIRAATLPVYWRADLRDRYLAAPWVARLAPEGVSQFRGRYGPALFTLLGLVALVLLVACANIANLLLARIAARRYEFSVQLALGAPLARVVRQLLTESLVLSALGATIGLMFAQWGSRFVVRQLSSWAYTAVLDFSLDWRVLGVTAVTTIGTALLFGTAPAYRAVRAEPLDALKGQLRGLEGRRGAGLGGGLVVLQVALCLMLVVGAGLFVRSFSALAYRDLGFDRQRVLVAVLDARRVAARPAGRARLYERVRDAVATVPGVESAATSMATPLGSAGVRFTPTIATPGNANGPEARILMAPVSPGWFRTWGTRILVGRDFDARDRAGAPSVAIVNDAFARKYFGTANPIGRTLLEVTEPKNRRALEIVGLVENAAFTSVRDPIEPTMYRPFDQQVDEELLTSAPSVTISVRLAGGGSSSRLTSAVTTAVANVDRELSVSIQTVTEQLDNYYIRERLLAVLSGFFGALALILAGLGLYGVTSYSVARRRIEIGIRMALGAPRSGVIRLVLSRVSRLVSLGIVLGAAVSLWASKFVATLLYGLEPRDPATLFGAALTLGAVAALAGWLPAWRASSVDPADVLRES
jgi:putative ABC transport system permease protein